MVFVQCGKKKKVEGEKRFELETDEVNGTINTFRTRLIYLRKENQNENAVSRTKMYASSLLGTS